MKTFSVLDRTVWSATLLSMLFAAESILGEEVIRHSLFIAGPTFTGILNEDGTEQWRADRPAARDGFLLSDGRLLIAWKDEVVEYSAAKPREIVFRYVLSKSNREIAMAARLENDNTLVAEQGPEPKLLEIKADGSIAHSLALLPETDNAHMQTRLARKLPNGNYLVPHLLAFCVKEYAPDGRVVRLLRTDLESLGGRPAENWPFTAIRLADGHTLVSLTHGNKVVEFDEHGQIVWRISNDDFPSHKPFVDPCGIQRLPNGNTVIASYGATKGIKIFEVTPAKEIVWRYEGPYRAHGLQVLTTNGQTVPGLPAK